MKNEVKNLVDAYINKQSKSYERTNNFDRCFHRFQGYIECLIDMGMVNDNERAEILDYMSNKLEGVEAK